MKLPRRTFLHLAAGTFGLPAVSRLAWAQAYPTRAVRFIVPFPSGGPPDLVLRLCTQRLSQDWNQPIIVENRPGATGTVGTDAAVRAPPDGYTLLFTADLPITMVPALRKLNYDPQRDLTAIAAITEAFNVLVVNASTGLRSLAELVASAKANPGRLAFASAGYGSPAHLCGEMIMRKAGIDMVHVPYPGASQAMNMLLAGEVDMFCGPTQLALPYIRNGTIVALGVTGAKPSALLPGLAPLSETWPGLVISDWLGLFAPARTPASVIGVLREEFKRVSAEPEMERKLLSFGKEPTWISGADFTRRIADDTVRWRDFIAATNIKPG